MNEPKLPQHLTETTWNRILAQEEWEAEQCLIESINFEEDEACDFRFVQVIIRDCRLNNSSIKRLNALDVRFENCDLSNVDFSKSSIHRVVFERCKLVGTIFQGSSLGDVTFESCKMNFSLFNETKLKNVFFNQCDLEQSDFYAVKYQSLQFEQCRLSGLQMQQTDLATLDLRSSQFTHLIVDLERLKGCRVTMEQALILASLLGIQIE